MLQRHFRLIVFVLAGWWVAGVSAIEPAEALRPSIAVASELLRPGDPVRLQFSLVNSSDEAVALGTMGEAHPGETVTLPLNLVFGDPRKPSISIQTERGAPQMLLPPALNSQEPISFSLAPRGLVGVELDMREYARELRYPGRYTIAWRPFGLAGRVARVTLRIEDKKDAMIVTDYGKVLIRLDYERAPQNVDNFIDLVRSGFYDGLELHRVVPGFAASGGCPAGDGSGMRPDGQTIPAEFADVPIDVGTVAMARKPTDPDSASCQFFIALGRFPELDGQYSVIGFARDPSSLGTLRAINDIATDRNYRPLQPLIIRSVNLIDRDLRAADLDLTGSVALPASNLPPRDFRNYSAPPPPSAPYDDRAQVERRRMPSSMRNAMPAEVYGDRNRQPVAASRLPVAAAREPVSQRGPTPGTMEPVLQNRRATMTPANARPPVARPMPRPPVVQQPKPAPVQQMGQMTPVPHGRATPPRMTPKTNQKPAQPMQEMTPVGAPAKG